METLTQTKRKTVCFAYFGDGKFLGWYADTCGSVRKNSPKLYGYTEDQVETIKNNFRNNLSDLNEKSDLGNFVHGLSLMDKSLNEDKEELSKYSSVELRVVECPYYDGPNPNYDDAKYVAWVENERSEKGNDFKFADCPTELNHWLYCDYAKVKEWASVEPTEFLETILK